VVQAKENADDLVAKKKDLDAQVEAKRKETKEYEIVMRQKASTAGNIVGKDVPVSSTEVRSWLCFWGSMFLILLSRTITNSYGHGTPMVPTAHLRKRWILCLTMKSCYD
jgi:hypothetical protein